MHKKAPRQVINSKKILLLLIKNSLISIILILFMTSPLFGQSEDEKRFALRTAFVVNALTYNLDKQNSVGFHFGQIPPTKINLNNVETLEKNFYGLNYAYGFDCINCDSYFVVAILNNGSSIIITDDGSTYTYSGWGLSLVGGYSWYFENDISVILGTGPSYSSESRESENIKSDNGFGTDADERMEKIRFLPLVPFFLIGYSF